MLLNHLHFHFSVLQSLWQQYHRTISRNGQILCIHRKITKITFKNKNSFIVWTSYALIVCNGRKGSKRVTIIWLDYAFFDLVYAYCCAQNMAIGQWTVAVPMFLHKMLVIFWGHLTSNEWKLKWHCCWNTNKNGNNEMPSEIPSNWKSFLFSFLKRYFEFASAIFTIQRHILWYRNNNNNNIGFQANTL